VLNVFKRSSFQIIRRPRVNAEMNFPKLFQPGRIGKLKIKNRVVMSPMGLHYNAGVNGEVTNRTIAYYGERAKGGVGLIMVGLSDPMPSAQRPTIPMLSLGGDRFIRGHYYLAEAVHAYDARIGIQLGHLGAQMSMAAHGGRATLSPSGIQMRFVDGHAYDSPRPLTRAEVYELIEFFALASGRAKEAGYDLVEIHAAHGYLIGSFMSLATNTRDDEFGGSLENRMRLPVEIIRRVKEICGMDYPISIRISADEFIEGGITLKESSRMAKMLEQAGASVINVSCGIYETLHKSNDIMRMEEGWKRPIWDRIKKSIAIPTIAAGGNRTPELCEKVIVDGIADFVGLGRQFIADPMWPRKALEGRVEDIRKCTSCLQCLFNPKGTLRVAPRCSVNAEEGREVEWAELRATSLRKKVLVVGGGVAGMEAARIASSRGHEVTLCEKGRELGGQLLLGAVPPGKQKWLWFRNYLVTQLEKQGVKIRLAVEVSPQLVDEIKPDVVVVATGGEPLLLGIKGLHDKKMITSWDVLKGKVQVDNRKVVILGGGTVGCETAEFLAEKGNEVTILEMLPLVAADMDPLNRRGLLEKLVEYKVNLRTGLKVEEVKGNTVIGIDLQTAERCFVEAEVLVLAMGTQPVRELVEALEGQKMEVYTAGDCKEPRKIMDAVYEGAWVGRQI
jgi:2,4-dienoyl-CoA reductase-like NADH-dependent reductase (Old Yellow Enzyme family)/thioredoxin reductase